MMVEQKRTPIHQVDQCSTNKRATTEHTKEFHGRFDWLRLKTVSIKNRFYDRKVRDTLETDIAVVRYEQDQVFNKTMGTLLS